MKCLCMSFAHFLIGLFSFVRFESSFFVYARSCSVLGMSFESVSSVGSCFYLPASPTEEVV